MTPMYVFTTHHEQTAAFFIFASDLFLRNEISQSVQVPFVPVRVTHPFFTQSWGDVGTEESHTPPKGTGVLFVHYSSIKLGEKGTGGPKTSGV